MNGTKAMPPIDHTAAVTAIYDLHNPVTSDFTEYMISGRALNMQTESEMLNDGDVEDLDGWVVTSETIMDFKNEGWIEKARNDGAVKLTRADGSDIFIACIGDRNLTFLDRA